MPPAQENTRFCSECGTKVLKDAAFCIECGSPIGGGDAARSAGASAEARRRLAPLIVVGVLLAVGASIITVGYNNQPPPNAPLAGSPSGAPSVAANGSLPADHPPLTIPDDVRDVIVRMEKLAADQPDNVEAWKQLAFVQYRAGQVERAYLDKAENSYQKVLDADPKDLDGLRGMGNIAYDRNDPTKALEYYRAYLQVKPDDQSIRTDMGTMLLAAKRPDEAIRVYQAVLQQDPTFFQAQFNLAIAYRAAGQNDLALAALHRSREVAPDEDSRKRVEAVLARVGTATAPSAAQASSPTGSLRESVEAVFRSHPIVGPRIDAIRWSSDERASVVLREFPMGGMPPMVREKFVSRLRSGIRESKKRFGKTDPIEIQLVDAGSGNVMLTLTE